MNLFRLTAVPLLLLTVLAGCGGSVAVSSSSSLQVYAVSATATAAPAATATPVPAATATAIVPSPTPTTAPITYTLEFSAERKDDVTLRVGQAIQLRLTTGSTSDWLSGVDDARVLRPMSPDGNGVYQAMMPGTALLTAHALYGCARVTPGVPCRNPEHGLWFQTRVNVVA